MITNNSFTFRIANESLSLKFWASFAAISIAISWLLPNHHYPWLAFHSDAWMGVCLMAIVLCSETSKFKAISVTRAALILFLLSLAPIAQWLFGVMPTMGQAIVSSLYISAGAVAYCMAYNMQKHHGDLALNVLFGACSIASVLSVAIQLIQWLAPIEEDMSGLGLWLHPQSVDSRPSANLGQPNLLATLLMWGILSGLWLRTQVDVNRGTWFLYSIYLSIGLALTQSRSGLIEILGVAGILIIKMRKSHPLLVKDFCALTVCTFLLFFLISWFSELLHLSFEGRAIDSLVMHSNRTDAYQIFLHAIVQKPWTGFGITHLSEPQWVASGILPSLNTHFIHAHNLPLELIAWLGIPLGTLVVISLCYWLITRLLQSLTDKQTILYSAITIVSLHSMVELPYQYAFIIIPVCWFAGGLDALQLQFSYSISRISRVLVAIGLSTLFALVIYDYFQFEEPYQQLRFNQGKIGRNIPVETPNLLVLDQFEDLMRLNTFVPKTGLAETDIAWMERAVRASPSHISIYNYAVTLALNEQPDKAQLWMSRFNTVTMGYEQRIAASLWKDVQAKHPKLAPLEWPKTSASDKMSRHIN